MEDSSLAPFAVQCSKVQRRKKKQSSKMLVLNLFLAVSVSFLFFFSKFGLVLQQNLTITCPELVVHNLTNSIEFPEYFQLCTQTHKFSGLN